MLGENKQKEDILLIIHKYQWNTSKYIVLVPIHSPGYRLQFSFDSLLILDLVVIYVTA